MIDRVAGRSVAAAQDADVRGGGKDGVERKAEEPAPVDRADLGVQVRIKAGGLVVDTVENPQQPDQFGDEQSGVHGSVGNQWGSTVVQPV